MVEFIIRDRDHPDYNPRDNVEGKRIAWKQRVVKRKGQLFDIDGERIELFPAGILAEAIDRSVKTLYEFEKRGIIPKPLFSVSGKGPIKRWYSAAQVINLHRLALYRYHYMKARHFNAVGFAADVKKVFYARDVIVDTDGRINTDGIQN